jgi:hypothetical protein
MIWNVIHSPRDCCWPALRSSGPVPRHAILCGWTIPRLHSMAFASDVEPYTDTKQLIEASLAFM